MKTVLISGASSGIGLAASTLFLERDWQVVMLDKNEDKVINENFEKQYGEKVHFFKADVSKDRDIKDAHKFVVEKCGGLDCLINNAGTITHGMLHEATEEAWEKVFNVDVKSIFLTGRHFLPDMMAKKSGVIVNTASIAGLAGDYLMPIYNAAKGAVVNLTRAMALDYADYNIRVNAVCPGPVDTPMIHGGFNVEKLIQANPMKRLCKPREIACAMYFLASDEASFCNGVNLPVTGGLDVQTGQPRPN